MELEQAIERCKELTKSEHDKWIGLTNQEAIETVLQALEELQKENEKLKEIDLTTVHINGVCDEKKRWKNKIKDRIKYLEKLIREDEEELKKNPDPVNSKFNSFDEYYEWKHRVKYRDKLYKGQIDDLKILLQGE